MINLGTPGSGEAHDKRRVNNPNALGTQSRIPSKKSRGKIFRRSTSKGGSAIISTANNAIKTRNERPIETRLKLLERHLFRRKIGYDTLDEGVD